MLIKFIPYNTRQTIGVKYFLHFTIRAINHDTLCLLTYNN